jgi:putative PIG3 family NAD(P)H quinone oxidoreductase
MRAVVFEAGQVHVRERPAPTPGPGEVAVRVRAAGLNRADLMQLAGKYPAPPGAPADIPGLEWAGEVEALGEGVSGVKAGDRVMGIAAGGALAERLVSPASLLVPVPAALAWAEAGALMEAFVTAHDALFTRGRLAAGEAVLVHAVGSGVGTAAVQLARAAGARVAGTSRTQDKLDRCAALGLTAGVVPQGGLFAAAVRERVGPVQLVVDCLGMPALAENLEVLAPLGRLVCLGSLTGAKGELDLGKLMFKRLTLVGTVLRARSTAEKAEASQAMAAFVLPRLAAGALRPVVERVLPLDQAAEAYALLAANGTFGKVVLSLG